MRIPGVQKSRPSIFLIDVIIGRLQVFSPDFWWTCLFHQTLCFIQYSTHMFTLVSYTFRLYIFIYSHLEHKHQFHDLHKPISWLAYINTIQFCFAKFFLSQSRKFVSLSWQGIIPTANWRLTYCVATLVSRKNINRRIVWLRQCMFSFIWLAYVLEIPGCISQACSFIPRRFMP